MHVYVDGLPYIVGEDDRRKYALGPFRFLVRDGEARAYNRVVARFKEVKDNFRARTGREWEPSDGLPKFHKDRGMDTRDLKIFATFKSYFEEAAQLYDGPPIPEAELQDLMLEPVGETNG